MRQVLLHTLTGQRQVYVFSQDVVVSPEILPQQVVGFPRTWRCPVKIPETLDSNSIEPHLEQRQMGEFKFRIPTYWDFQTRHASSVHVIGLDGIPGQCRISQAGPMLTISRSNSESGKVYCVYPFESRGELLVCTGTLPERAEPYSLILELARGTLNRLNNQFWIWREGGLEPPDEFSHDHRLATEQLGRAIFSATDAESDKHARLSLETSMHAIFRLGRAFAEKVVHMRWSEMTDNPFWMAANLQNGDWVDRVVATEAFDLIEYESRPAESANGSDTTPLFPCDVVFGPLLDASAGGRLPPTDKFDDFESRKRQIMLDCRQMLDRAPTETAMLHIACGLNGIGHRNLSYTQQLRLMVDLMNLVDNHSLSAPAMISFDIPWGERLAWSVGGAHPLQVADSLLRQAVVVGTLGLDINLDYWPGGSVARDPYQWLDLIDVWSQFGLPLVLCLRIPSGERCAVSEGSMNEIRAGSSEVQRLQLLETVLPMIMARPMVTGIIFRQWSDTDDERFPCGGLTTDGRSAKQIVSILRGLRTQWYGDRAT